MELSNLENIFLSKNGAVKEFPFDDVTMVFKVCGKMFGLIMTEKNPLQVNLKCDPQEALALREIHSCVREGYHMSKKHWNTITLDGTLEEREFLEMIDNSYNLIISKLTKKQRGELLNRE